MVPRYVLDTHSCIFALVAPNKLGQAGRRALASVEAGRSQAWIPAAVAAEFVLLRELGRIDLGPAHLETALEEAPSLRFLALDWDRLDEFAALGAIRDPFDRLIVSAARSVQAKLITRDSRVKDLDLV